MGRAKKVRETREIDRLHVPIEFKSFVLQKKAENPQKYRTNYDVLDDIMGKPNEKKKKGYFWGKI